jgi:hypothetical protein
MDTTTVKMQIMKAAVKYAQTQLHAGYLSGNPKGVSDSVHRESISDANAAFKELHTAINEIDAL